ncbi:polyprenyl synthetase family protein [Marispirochaeta sp.]|uniref:polyprenyl synthetase family protein n=1 Tax=Marispirochaeta sp. TaxID=2038653 RepID=UPI0029C74225|nr:polyprenyl synthetase family protein [Marispirochaeta sp.]
MRTDYIPHPGADSQLRDASFSAINTTPAVNALGDPRLTGELARVRSIILESAAGSTSLVRESLQDMINAGGKLIRPALVLLAGWYGGKNEKSLRSLAASVEMLHMATLIHDDVIDDAATRRGKPALHINVGAKAAILIGDYLFARCFTLLDSIKDRDIGLHAARAVEHICDGEIRQNTQRYTVDVGMRSYLRRILAKTAVLITVSLELGAQHGEASVQDVQRFRRIGYNLGMGFQIIDDLLDLTGNETRTGKPVAPGLAAGNLYRPRYLQPLRFRRPGITQPSCIPSLLR